MNRAASAGRLSPTTSPLVSAFAAVLRSSQVQSFVGSLTFGLSFMNALIESVSSASSVGDDDHPDIRTSPESAPLLALGVDVPGVPPHAATSKATRAITASSDWRFLIFLLPVRRRLAYCC